MIRKKSTIRIFIYENVMLYPPTINLIECLLNNDYKVHLVAEGVRDLPAIIQENKQFSYTEIKAVKNSNIFFALEEKRRKNQRISSGAERYYGWRYRVDC